MMERINDTEQSSCASGKEIIEIASDSDTETETETEIDKDRVKVNIKIDQNLTDRIVNHLNELDVFFDEFMDWAMKARIKLKRIYEEVEKIDEELARGSSKHRKILQ
jgi:hypothetical protein